jgi:hypothetical protein
VPDTWTPEWSNPVFSLEERDRRWASVRALMARDGVDVLACLPCTNNHDRGQQDVRYLTQLGENSDEVTVVFPLAGDVTAWLSRGGVWPASNWFIDIRAGSRGSGAKHVIGRLQELGFERGTIGIPGLRGGMLAHIRQPEGEVSWQSVELIKTAFPQATIVSATDLLGEARYVKSEEEIDFIRRGTEVAEKTLTAVLEHARPGVAEREVFGWMLQANAAAGAAFRRCSAGPAGRSAIPTTGWSSRPSAGSPLATCLFWRSRAAGRATPHRWTKRFLSVPRRRISRMG